MMRRVVTQHCFLVLLITLALPMAVHAQSIVTVNQDMTLSTDASESVNVLSRFSPIESVLLTFDGTARTDTLTAYRRSVVNIDGGVIDSLYALDHSEVNLTGGTVTGEASANLSSRVQVGAGATLGGLSGYDNSQVIIYGGAIVGNIVAEGHSRFIFRGAAFSAVPTGTFNADGKSGKVYSIRLMDSRRRVYRYTFRDTYAEPGHTGYHDPVVKFAFERMP